MRKDKEGNYRINAPGSVEGFMTYWPNSRCGDVKDGVALALGNGAGWVISLADLKMMVELAEKHRSDLLPKEAFGK